MKAVTGPVQTVIEATRMGIEGGDQLIRFNWSNSELTFSEILEMAGKVPVPPYLERDDEPIDTTRYQTSETARKIQKAIKE